MSDTPDPSLTRLPERGLGGRRKRRPERHDAILLAAVHLFHVQGYHATSVEEIAGEVGVSSTAVYRHFRNKQAILDTAALWVNEQLVERLQTVAVDCTLEERVDNLVDLTLELPHFVGMNVRELDSLSDEVRAFCMEARNDIVAGWCEELRRRVPEMSAGEARFRVDLAVGLICSIASRHDLDRLDSRGLTREMALASLIPGPPRK